MVVLLWFTIISSCFALIDFPFEMTAQCDCDDLKPCLVKMQQRLPPCIARCLATLDDQTDLTTALTCVSEFSELKETQRCVLKPFASICNQVQGLRIRIPRRNLTSLRSAAERRVRQVAGALAGSFWGPVDEVIGDMTRRFTRCLASCTAVGTGRCFEQLECGIRLPEDDQLITEVEFCAEESEITMATVIKWCDCFASSGMRIEPICNNLRRKKNGSFVKTHV